MNRMAGFYFLMLLKFYLLICFCFFIFYSFMYLYLFNLLYMAVECLYTFNFIIFHCFFLFSFCEMCVCVSSLCRQVPKYSSVYSDFTFILLLSSVLPVCDPEGTPGVQLHVHLGCLDCPAAGVLLPWFSSFLLSCPSSSPSDSQTCLFSPPLFHFYATFS